MSPLSSRVPLFGLDALSFNSDTHPRIPHRPSRPSRSYVVTRLRPIRANRTARCAHGTRILARPHTVARLYNPTLSLITELYTAKFFANPFSRCELPSLRQADSSVKPTAIFLRNPCSKKSKICSFKTSVFFSFVFFYSRYFVNLAVNHCHYTVKVQLLHAALKLSLHKNRGISFVGILRICFCRESIVEA